MENRQLTKTTKVTGKNNTYNCFYENYILLKKYNYNIESSYLYITASIYVKDGQILRNYSYINIHSSFADFMSVDLSIVDNMDVYFIDIDNYKKLSLEEIVEDIKSNHTNHNFYIDKLPQSL